MCTGLLYEVGRRGSHPQKAVADRGGCVTKYTVKQIVNFPEPGPSSIRRRDAPVWQYAGAISLRYLPPRWGKVALDCMDVRNYNLPVRQEAPPDPRPAVVGESASVPKWISASE